MAADHLPVCMQWIQAVALIFIALLGVFIAYQQMATARVKLQHDLFDKRFAVFEAVRIFIRAVQSGQVNDGDLNAFKLGTADALFLFEEDIINYIDQISERAAQLMRISELRKAKEPLGSLDLSEKETQGEYSLWFSVQQPSERFKRYMKIPVLEPVGIFTR